MLIIKSEYNYQNSLCKYEDVIKKIAEFGHEEIILCDDDILINALNFIKICKEYNIKPILGVEKKTGYNTSVLCLAKNNSGYEEITKMVSQNTVNTNCEDIIYIFRGDSKQQDIENYYYEDEVNQGNNLCIVHEVRIPDKSDLDAYVALSAIRHKTTYIKEKKSSGNYSKYILNKLHVNEKKIVDKIDELDFNHNYVDTLNVKTDILDFEKFLYIKLNEKKLNNSEYKKRLELELNVVLELGFESYFLIMYDIICYLKENDIMYGDGRGSAPGSLISYLLDITKIDPIQYGLYFERFLNPQRSTLPDIDLDISDRYRNQVVEYLIDKYGKEFVGKIMTINKYMTKSIVRDVCKILEFDSKSSDKISAHLDSSRTFDENIVDNYNFFKSYLNNPKFAKMQDIVNKLEKTPHNSSIHAAGVVISATNLYEIAPVLDNVVQSESKFLEKNGFVKFDLLSLSTLSFLDDLIKKANIDISTIKLDDELTYKHLGMANTYGIFQLESRGMGQVLRKFKPKSIYELGIILALYRPGPMKNIDLCIENKNNPNKIKYVDIRLKEILESTYGIIIFQEQIMDIAKKIAGFNPTEADIFRVAVSKKDKGAIKHQKEKFIKNGIALGGRQDVLEGIYSNIETFADYGFNKAHAISYASLIYKIMYMKVNFSQIFFSELFTKSVNSSSKYEFLSELKNLGVIMYAPCILKSNFEHRVSKNSILIGLCQIKKISKIKIEKLISLREKYLKSDTQIGFLHFFKEVILPCDFTYDEIEKLSHCSSFDKFKINKKTLDSFFKKYLTTEHELYRFINIKYEIEKEDEYEVYELIELENESLGFNLKYEPKNMLMREFKKIHPNINLIKIDSIEMLDSYTDYYSVFKVIEIKEIITKKNQKMAFLKLKKDILEYDMTIFPKEYETSKLIQNKYCIIEYTKDKNDKLVFKKNVL